ncbi:hypothetical protein BOTBODRAFT_30540 [Botryobasidium botryosum FD-172 SS1]|uniref:Uncharacterized protein n=1 Tax=Botryobasidium botryosum (strain FD-172 SS1) TaxID=930990 RepID=A0A067MM39_BOTB1|nr:hypothetical protein BOTBODRAFT_30540 [Botryobasidium botryosum FD-172 SS1]
MSLTRIAPRALQRSVQRPLTRSLATPSQPRPAAASPAADQKAKLRFRFGSKDVPIEVWPLGVVLIAGVVGGGVAITRHLMNDDELRIHRGHKMSQSTEETKKQ